MAAAVIAFGLAIALLLHAATTRIKERRLAARLRPVEARLIDPGRSASYELGGEMTPQTNDDDLPAVSAHYRARWSYTVEGTRHEGEISLGVPVFAENEVRFGRVQVFYDPDNPAFSTLRPGVQDKARGWFIASAIVAVFAVGFLIIAQRTGGG
jgi:hypothetical protein